MDATTPAHVTTTPADTSAVVPPPATQQAGTTLADVKAARRGKAKAPVEAASGTETGDARPAAAKPPTPAAAPAPVTPPPTTEAKIDMDPAALSQFTELNKAVRETKAKLKDTEAKLAEFGKIEKARGLSKEGKEYDAIRAAGFDVDKALAELIQQNPGAVASPELLALKREIDELKQAREGDTKKEAERAEAEAAASLKNDRTIAGKFVTENAAKYPHLAKAPELVDGVFKDFTDARDKLQKDSGPLSGDEQAKLMVDALAVHEEKWAKVFGSPAAAPGIDASVRAGAPTPAAKAPERMTFAQVKAARRKN